MTAPQVASIPERLNSLDAFRGLVIVLMFAVNVAGTDPAFPSWFPHRGWNNGSMGNGLADYVFPWFLFIVGAAIPFSLNSGRGRALSTPRKALAAARRGLTIYLLGTLLWCATIGYKPADPGARWHGPIDWRVLLHWDILPLIGWGYFLGVCLYLLGRGPFGIGARLVFVVLVLAAKFAILRLIPYPGESEAVWEQNRSLQSWINGRLGWLGVALTQGLPATACVVLGSFAGDRLRVEGVRKSVKAAGLAGIGLVGYFVALLAHRAGILPQSKDFFTSTYVLGTCGAATFALAVLFWVVDDRRWTSLTSLRVFGMNALAAYIGAELIWKCVMMQWRVTNPPGVGGSSVMITALKAHLHSWIGTSAGSVALVAGYVLLYWLICWSLHRRRIYVRV